MSQYWAETKNSVKFSKFDDSNGIMTSRWHNIKQVR